MPMTDPEPGLHIPTIISLSPNDSTRSAQSEQPMDNFTSTHVQLWFVALLLRTALPTISRSEWRRLASQTQFF